MHLVHFKISKSLNTSTVSAICFWITLKTLLKLPSPVFTVLSGSWIFSTCWIESLYFCFEPAFLMLYYIYCWECLMVLHQTSRIVRNVEKTWTVEQMIQLYAVTTNNITLTHILRQTAMWQQCYDYWFSMVWTRRDAKDKQSIPRPVNTWKKKKTIILSLQVLKPVTFLYYWPANISLSQNWMSTFPSSAMLATMIRFSLCNCENCTDPFWKPLFVWCRGTRIRGSSKRSEKGNCGTKRWLNCCKPVISWIYSILKSIHQTLLRALVPESCSLPVSRFRHEDTFRKVTVIAISRTEYDAVQIGTYIPIYTTYPNNTGNVRIT